MCLLGLDVASLELGMQALRAAHGKKEGSKKKRKRGADEDASSADEASDASDNAVGARLFRV